MLPLRIANETRRLATDQPEYIPLSIRDTRVRTQNGTVINAMVSLWEPDPKEMAALECGGAIYSTILTKAGTEPAAMLIPSPDELQRLRDGAGVYLTICGERFPPVSVYVVSHEYANANYVPAEPLAALDVQRMDAVTGT